MKKILLILLGIILAGALLMGCAAPKKKAANPEAQQEKWSVQSTQEAEIQKEKAIEREPESPGDSETE